MLVEFVCNVLQALLLHERGGGQAVRTDLQLVHRGELVLPVQSFRVKRTVSGDGLGICGHADSFKIFRDSANFIKIYKRNSPCSRGKTTLTAFFICMFLAVTINYRRSELAQNLCSLPLVDD
jgi:hypothetical protein